MKKTFLLLIMISMLLLTSCISMIVKNSIENTPVSNRIMLHDDVKKGDYAVYKAVINSDDPQVKAMAGETTVNLRITDIQGTDVYIEQTFNTTGLGGRYTNSFKIDLITDKSGIVKSGTLIDGEKIIPLKIAKPGDKTYNDYQKLNKPDYKKWNIPGEVTVPAGKFKVDAMYFTDKDSQEGVQAIYLGTDKVKFYNVATLAIDENNGNKMTTVMELIEQGNK